MNELKQEVEIIGSIADILLNQPMDQILNKMSKMDQRKFTNSIATLQVISSAITNKHQQSIKLVT